MFTEEGFSLISGFRKNWCLQEMDSVFIQVSQKSDVHQRNLYSKYTAHISSNESHFLDAGLLFSWIYILKKIRHMGDTQYLDRCGLNHHYFLLLKWEEEKKIQSGTTPLFKALWVGLQMHQSTSRAPRVSGSGEADSVKKFGQLGWSGMNG